MILSILWMTKRLIASSFFFTPCHFRCSAVSDVTSLLLRSPSPWLHQLLPFLSLVTPECGCGCNHLHRRHDYQSLSFSSKPSLSDDNIYHLSQLLESSLLRMIVRVTKHHLEITFMIPRFQDIFKITIHVEHLLYFASPWSVRKSRLWSSRPCQFLYYLIIVGQYMFHSNKAIRL